MSLKHQILNCGLRIAGSPCLLLSVYVQFLCLSFCLKKAFSDPVICNCGEFNPKIVKIIINLCYFQGSRSPWSWHDGPWSSCICSTHERWPPRAYLASSWYVFSFQELLQADSDGDTKTRELTIICGHQYFVLIWLWFHHPLSCTCFLCSDAPCFTDHQNDNKVLLTSALHSLNIVSLHCCDQWQSQALLLRGRLEDLP